MRLKGELCDHTVLCSKVWDTLSLLTTGLSISQKGFSSKIKTLAFWPSNKLQFFDLSNLHHRSPCCITCNKYLFRAINIYLIRRSLRKNCSTHQQFLNLLREVNTFVIMLFAKHYFTPTIEVSSTSSHFLIRF